MQPGQILKMDDQQQPDLDPNLSSERSPTVDQILKMIARRTNAPPIPPKPSRQGGSTSEGTPSSTSSSATAIANLKRYFTTQKVSDSYSPSHEIDGKNFLPPKSVPPADCYKNRPQPSERNHRSPKHPDSLLASDSHLTTDSSSHQRVAAAINLARSTTQNNMQQDYAAGVSMESSAAEYDSGRHSNNGNGSLSALYTAQHAIVTEQNNNGHPTNHRSSGERLPADQAIKSPRTSTTTTRKSTVEILEIPFQSVDTSTSGFNKDSVLDLTPLAKGQRLYDENNQSDQSSLANPTVSIATSEEDCTSVGTNGNDHNRTSYQTNPSSGRTAAAISLVRRKPSDATYIVTEAGALLDSSAATKTSTVVGAVATVSPLEQPPRTSTPNDSSSSPTEPSRLDDGQDSGPGAIVVTPTSASSPSSGGFARVSKDRRADVDGRRPLETPKRSLHEQDYEFDLLNSSHDRSNQSGGCEVVGLYEISDRSASSKSSNETQAANLTGASLNAPYTVEMFGDTLNNTSKSATRQPNSSAYLDCQQQIRSLERFASLLKTNLDSIADQMRVVVARVDGLETKLDSQEDKLRQLFDRQGNDKRTNSPLGQSNFSRSSGNLSRIHPAGIGNHATLTHSSTYTRPSGSSLAKKSHNTSLGATSTPSTRYSPHPHFSSATKSLRKSNIHASMGSLSGGDTLRSVNNSSISPSQQFYQSSSPTSMLGTLARRDPMSHTSMLSLSSIGGSTLKRGGAGSVSNLSQMGSQLAGWSSISNFVSTKSRGKEVTHIKEEGLIKMMLYDSLIQMFVPNRIDYNLDKNVEPPSVRLKLGWVYGYRGRDCRSNIHYLPTGECVYFVASIIVLHDPVERKQRFYLGHTDNVKCLTMHPNKLYIASGQSASEGSRDKRPIVRVWNTVNLATLRVIGFNEDFDRSICCLAFSKHDQGATLVVVDESDEHTITLLDWQRDRNWRLSEANGGHDPVLAIDFHPVDQHSLVTVGRAGINFWDIRGMTLTKKAGLFDKYDKPKYVLCLTFNDLSETITGDSNGNIIIWPRASNRPKRIIHDVHPGGVFSVLALKTGGYLTGGRDRRVIEWDENFTRTGREAELPEHCGGVRYITYAKGTQVLVGTLKNCILIGSLDKGFSLMVLGHSEATSTLTIHPKSNHYLTGGFDDQVHLFDSNTHEVLWSKCLSMPATAASFSPDGCLLIVGSTNGNWVLIDSITQETVFTKTDGSGSINCIKFSPDGEHFTLGSSDNNIYVYQTSDSGSTFCNWGACIGHSAPVKEIDWSDDSQYFQSQSLNFELLHWKASNCKPLEDREIIEDLNWFTHNCTIGFNVIGLWSDSSDSELINSCDKSNKDDLMVSVTSSGNINIFKWPPCYNQCLSQKYYGNVQRFDFIKFLPDDSKLIAVGAKSCVTTEWTIDKSDSGA